MAILELRKRYHKNKLSEFADKMREISAKIGFKVSARGWCYLLETERYINKDQFDKVEGLINSCRKQGLLPVDFVAEEKAREFEGVERIDKLSVVKDSEGWLNGFENSGDHYTPNWWKGERYYIQMIVEKVDLISLFKPVCDEYHIPIANSKGWGSVLQRATYARRYKEAEDLGLECVLLYCGDHDPDGLRISEFLRSNLDDLRDVRWSDGESGYDPENLIIDRFGLNYDFIIENDLTWIDNLITGSGKNLAAPNHKNHNMPYLQAYLRDIGERKVEANAIVTTPGAARALCEAAIVSYVGEDCKERFELKRKEAVDEFDEFLDSSGARELVNQLREIIYNY